MEVIGFPISSETTSIKWDMSELEKDLLISTKLLYVEVLTNREDDLPPYRWVAVSVEPIPQLADLIPFQIDLSTPWLAPSYIPFVPQNMYEDFKRHRQLYVNMKANNRGIFFTTYEFEQ